MFLRLSTGEELYAGEETNIKQQYLFHKNISFSRNFILKYHIHFLTSFDIKQVLLNKIKIVD